MLHFLFAEQNFWFGLALIIVVFIALLEGVGVLLGLSVSSMLDNLFSVDTEFDADMPDSALSSLLGWLCLDRVPLLVWLLVLLTSFGISGYCINYTLTAELALPVWITVLVSMTLALVVTRKLVKVMGQMMPKNESAAVSSQEFTGLVATITLGTASQGKAAEAVLKDQFEQKHYVMVEPEDGVEPISQGDQVILKHKTGSVWRVIKL